MNTKLGIFFLAGSIGMTAHAAFELTSKSFTVDKTNTLIYNIRVLVFYERW